MDPLTWRCISYWKWVCSSQAMLVCQRVPKSELPSLCVGKKTCSGFRGMFANQSWNGYRFNTTSSWVSLKWHRLFKKREHIFCRTGKSKKNNKTHLQILALKSIYFLSTPPFPSIFLWKTFWFFVHNSRCVKNQVVVSNMFYFHPYLGKWSNLTNNFPDGLKPPTRKCVNTLFQP